MDCLDRWLFFTINNMGGKVYVTNSIIDHELSVKDYNKFMNEERYRNILMSETLFMKYFMTKLENYIYYLRLMKRVIYLFFAVNNKRYSFITLSHLRNIVLPSASNKNNIETGNRRNY